MEWPWSRNDVHAIITSMTTPHPTQLPEKLALAALPTPLQPLTRLGSTLGIELFVKRDDLTGSQLSGNKVRKLDFILADARNRHATTVITCGGLHSNHCRATALAAAQLGMKSLLLLRTPNGLATDLPSPPHGNLLLDLMAGARIVTCTPSDYRERRGALMQDLADQLAASGERPYLVPEGGSNALGALGYVACVRELLAQLASPPAVIIAATGSGGTLAGLALGCEDAGIPTHVIGVAVCDDAPYFEAIVERIAAEAHANYGLPALTPGRYRVLEGFQGRGYGLTTEPELAFMLETLRHDGLALDPVYTNKAFLGLVRTFGDVKARQSEASGSRPEGLPLAHTPTVVFIHTGGIFGLSTFAAEIAQAS